MLPLETLIELSKKDNLTEQDERILIMYFIYHRTGGVVTGIFVGQIQTIPIGSKELWNKNVEIAKNWFKTIEI